MGHETAGVVQVTIADEHAEHHAGGDLYPRLSSINAIVTAGETKMVMFIPATAGTYAITDPSNSNLTGSLIVF